MWSDCSLTEIHCVSVMWIASFLHPLWHFRVQCSFVTSLIQTAVSHAEHTSSRAGRAVPVRGIGKELTFPPSVAR